MAYPSLLLLILGCAGPPTEMPAGASGFSWTIAFPGEPTLGPKSGPPPIPTALRC